MPPKALRLDVASQMAASAPDSRARYRNWEQFPVHTVLAPDRLGPRIKGAGTRDGVSSAEMPSSMEGRIRTVLFPKKVAHFTQKAIKR
jgi:hypothetical protein